jgi:formate dehydrogenase subunit delta
VSAGSTDKLVYMANQIASFFGSQPSDTGPLRVADHLIAFWDPRMRRIIVEHLDHGGAGLSPVALEAVKLVKTRSAAKIEQALAPAGEVSPGLTTQDDAG